MLEKVRSIKCFLFVILGLVLGAVLGPSLGNLIGLIREAASEVGIQDVLGSVEFWKIAAPAVFATIAWFVNEKKKRDWELWQVKKNACLKALNIANAILSNRTYTDEITHEKIIPTPQYESAAAVRACMNELACTCESSEVIDNLKKIMFEKDCRPSEMLNLRAAVRRELKLTPEMIDKDRDRTFISNVNCEPRKENIIFSSWTHK